VLTALPFPDLTSATPATDFAAIAQAILDDQNVARPIVPGAWMQNGMLVVPNRGILYAKPGDWVAVDNRGWPILLSADTLANGNWTHSGALT
jgi:hypothetical protein